ncbi:MAG: glycosyltransferase family 4 protein [Candidatus Eisenbacteria bacterium]|nr:glycosyltransferase family 4 protein [Candidatus Eisenbacteria bacterium]
MSDRGRLCLYAPYLYPVASGGEIPFVGGAEVQQWLLARGLARRGFDVSVATCDYGQAPRLEREGVSLLRTFPPQAGLPGLRFFHPRLTRAFGALSAADAEVYFVQGSGLPAGLARDVARLRGAGFVFLGAHDFDAIPALPLAGNLRDRWWYRRALRGADARISQTEAQRRLFRENFGLDSAVITNPVELPPTAVDPGQDGAVVWLATYKPSKRPEWFTGLARRLPGQRFVMCGVIPAPPLTKEAYDAALAVAAGCPNLEVRGFIEHERLGELYRDASLFVHTSPAEGFPNTVLEAWAWGLPTVTAVDPDGVIRRNGLGDVVSTLDELVASVTRFMSDPAARRAVGARARAYAAEHHAPDAVYDRLAALLDGVVAKVRARRGPR